MTDILQPLFEESTVAFHRLGQLYIDPNGDKYRYVQFGVSAAAGSLLQEPAEDTNDRSMVVQAAVAIGATSIPITLGGTAVTANKFENGTLIIESSTGLGQKFRIVRHTVQTSTTGTCTFEVDRPVKIALTTSSQASVRKNAYDAVIIHPTTPTGGAVGVALYTYTAASYGWIQSGGDCPVLFDTGTNTSTEVTQIVPSAAVAGSVKPLGTVGMVAIGYAREIISVDSTMGMCHLTID